MNQILATVNAALTAAGFEAADQMDAQFHDNAEGDTVLRHTFQSYRDDLAYGVMGWIDENGEQGWSVVFAEDGMGADNRERDIDSTIQQALELSARANA